MDMDAISALLMQLMSPGNEKSEGGDAADNGKDEGIFGNIDAETLLKLMDIFSKLSEEDKDTKLLMALKPYLRTENQAKLQRAAMLMKIMSIIPLLRDSGLSGNLF